MPTKIRKSKKCQWVEGVTAKYFSAFVTCKNPPTFEVQESGITVGHVCTKHSISATQNGWQIR